MGDTVLNPSLGIHTDMPVLAPPPVVPLVPSKPISDDAPVSLSLENNLEITPQVTVDTPIQAKEVAFQSKVVSVDQLVPIELGTQIQVPFDNDDDWTPWQVGAFSAEGVDVQRCQLTNPVDDNGKTKALGVEVQSVPWSEVLKLNPSLLPKDCQVFDLNTDKEWQFQAIKDDKVLLRGIPDTDTEGQTTSIDFDEFLIGNMERLTGAPVVPPSALDATKGYAQQDLWHGAIPDGFVDPGFRTTVDEDSNVTQSIGLVNENANREWLVVDRQLDHGLRSHLDFARRAAQVVADKQYEPEKGQRLLCKLLMGNVFNEMGKKLEGKKPEWLESHGSQPVMIGSVAKQEGGGVCRHRALLFSLMAHEAGLDVSIRRGRLKGATGGAHTWNEVMIGNKPHVVDVMNFPNDLHEPNAVSNLYFTYGDPKKGGKPIYS